mgnify:CR=1 FL=1
MKNLLYIFNLIALSYIIIAILTLYIFGMGVYAAYTADTNRPNDDSNGLFIACYVICIIQSIIYLISGILLFIYIITYNSNKNNNSNNTNSNSSKSNNSLVPFLLNIYWLVIYFNYDVSEKYNEYALVKMIEFFTVIGLVSLICIGSCIWMCQEDKGNEESKKGNKETIV